MMVFSNIVLMYIEMFEAFSCSNFWPDQICEVVILDQFRLIRLFHS